ncbi:MAG TPA: SGNH/GDSL hydrolase family protein [Gammaproteobacteria bacterium]|nr:SGNH/GDSL hydrolase family protein [Gammaproteobacteria bacterium]
MRVPGYIVIGLAVFIPSVTALLVADPGYRGLHFLAKAATLLSVVGVVGTWVLLKSAGREKTRQVFATLLLLTVSLGISLVVAEYAVRFAFSDITTTVDNSSYFARTWNRLHPPVINRYGFREREFSREKPEGIYRIAVIGDSLTYGQGIKAADRLTNILENSLNESGARYEVLNFGHPGAETIDEVEILKKYVIDISPDFVLLQWFVNDVEGHDKAAEQKPYSLLPSNFLTRYLKRHSALYYLANAKWKSLQGSLGLVKSHNDYIIQRFSDPDSQASRAGSAALEDFFKLAKAQSIPVGVVMFPRLLEVNGSVDNYPFGFLIKHATSTCKRNNVPCLDLRSVLAKVQPAQKLWANRLDPHPGRLANELAGKAVLDKFGDTWENPAVRD